MHFFYFFKKWKSDTVLIMKLLHLLQKERKCIYIFFPKGLWLSIMSSFLPQIFFFNILLRLVQFKKKNRKTHTVDFHFRLWSFKVYVYNVSENKITLQIQLKTSVSVFYAMETHVFLIQNRFLIQFIRGSRKCVQREYDGYMSLPGGGRGSEACVFVLV